jgi:hypothetical protein
MIAPGDDLGLNELRRSEYSPIRDSSDKRENCDFERFWWL